MNTREDLGWRVFVIIRDGGCIAPRLDPEAGPCYDAWGKLQEPSEGGLLEVDYVRYKARGRRHELPGDHVCLCAGHHRGTGPQGGYVWATAHRQELRAYLDRQP